MAIIRPKKEENKEYTSFTGVCEFGIMEFTDKSADFDWADLFIEITVRQKGSDFDRNIAIKGNFDKEGDKITGGATLKKMYHFFDQIGCDAGITVDGKWENSDGEPIDNIGDYLNKHHVKASSKGAGTPDLDYLGYFYKQQPKVPGGKSYLQALARVYKNTNANVIEMTKHVNWMKSKGYIKELTGDTPAQPTMNSMSGSALGNL